MNPDRWKQIDQLLQAAFDLPTEKRSAFLDQACFGDDVLRKEIEALLVSDERARSFIEAPALQAAQELLAKPHPGLSAGQVIGPYTILSMLGAGGMGEVYAAQDTRLRRKVAIKLLPAHLSGNEEMRIRFEREARVVSSLSHPNICSIYDVGHQDGIDYLVMEFIEGKTLSEFIQKGNLPVRTILDCAVGIADGLSAAHRAGIIHRDLKPANIMITAEGRVKILDFGLAKLRTSLGGEEQETASGPITRTGVIQGTFPYMSPEQAKGQSVDFHTDQFSFGSILYEMATGKRAFARDTAPQTLAAIIAEDPVSLASLNPKIPAPLRWIIDRCLAKEPHERYDSTIDLYKHLRDLRDHLSESSSAIIPVAAKKPHLKYITAAVFAFALIAAAFLLTQTWKPQPLSYHRLTYQKGFISSARFTPDGQSIVYRGAFGQNPGELFLARMQGATSRPLGIKNADILSVSRSEQMAILFHKQEGWFEEGVLAEVPLSGGSPREIADHVWSASWTPDGSMLAVVRGTYEKNRIELPLGKVLYETPLYIRELRFSPNGRFVAFNEHRSKDSTIGSVVIMDLHGKRIATSQGLLPEGTAWFNSDEVWISSFDPQVRAGSEIYALSTSGKQRLIQRFPRSLIHDISSTGQLMISLEDLRGVTVVSTGGEQHERDFSWLDSTNVADLSSDGQTLLLQETEEGGGLHGTVYLRNIDGSPPVRLEDGYARNFSKDGKYVLIWNVEESRLILLPTGVGETRSFDLKKFTTDNTFLIPTLFPDGKRILFVGKEAGHPIRIYVQDVSGGDPRAVAKGALEFFHNTISPDGNHFIGITEDLKLYVFPIDGGEPRPVLGFSTDEIPFQWSNDGGEIYVFKKNTLPLEIYRVNPLNGNRKLVKAWKPFDPTGLIAFSPVVRISGDEKIFAFSYFINLSTLFLVSGVK